MIVELKFRGRICYEYCSYQWFPRLWVEHIQISCPDINAEHTGIEIGRMMLVTTRRHVPANDLICPGGLR